MLSILIHSSKTMRMPGSSPNTPLAAPALLPQARQLISELRQLAPDDIATLMHLSDKKTTETCKLIEYWSDTPAKQTPAIDAFIGDIYSGLQVQSLSPDDRNYAHNHLIILSGLYGALRACDGIYPYRLEMGYPFKPAGHKNLYSFWGDMVAKQINGNVIINLSAVEYTKTTLAHLADRTVITPKFLTISSKTGEPTFVTVHAKVARGAFAHWMIVNRIQSSDQLPEFNELNYRFSAELSTPEQPVFVCQTFGGLGLSVRLR